MCKCNAEFMVADVAPAAIRLVHATRHVGVTTHQQTVRKQELGIVRQQFLDDFHAVSWVAILTLCVQTAGTDALQHRSLHARITI